MNREEVLQQLVRRYRAVEGQYELAQKKDEVEGVPSGCSDYYDEMQRKAGELQGLEYALILLTPKPFNQS